jgi:hypothetical protein
MLGNQHFYNRTIRKIVVAFGTLFNDIKLIRYSNDQLDEYETIKVPLSYGPKEKFITRLTSDPTLTKSISTSLPRMSFDMEGMTYDSTRKKATLQQSFYTNTTTKSFNSQYAPVPYNFDFSLSIYVRNIEDGTQIIEQILPYFTPDFTVTINFIPTMGKKYDMPVILNSVNHSIDYEGDFSSTRMVIWTLQFTAKAYIFPAVVTNTKLIKSANTNIHIDTESKTSGTYYVDYANGHHQFIQGEVVRLLNRGWSGYLEYFSNNSTGEIQVSHTAGVLKVGDRLQGDDSGALYTVSSIVLQPQHMTTIFTQPNPPSANATDFYGFTETFTEWPETPQQ